jgi:hypothetical protein
MSEETEHKLNLRHLTLDDFEDIKKLMDAVYSGLGGAWPEKKFRSQLKVFQDGQICIEDHGVDQPVLRPRTSSIDRCRKNHSAPLLVCAVKLNHLIWKSLSAFIFISE